MKELLNKVKNFFKGMFKAIDKHTDNDGYTAFLIFMFYVSLVFAAVSFLIGLFQAMKFGGALLIVAGSYFSIRILYNFTKDFVGLIKLYLESKKKDGEN